MILADKEDRTTVIEVLSNAFLKNKSVKYILKDCDNIDQVRALMNYSFEVCRSFGQVILSEDKSACALILYPQKKKVNLKSVWLDFKLIYNVIGLSGIKKAMAREAAIKKIHPKLEMAYLWFIAVDPEMQRRGIGTNLMKELIQQSEINKLPLFLETSTVENLPWYESLGFRIYGKLEFTYTLYFLHR